MKSVFKKQQKRRRVAVFAPWATIEKTSPESKHHIENTNIVYHAKANETYANHIEMAGFFCSSIISYGHDADLKMKLMRHVIFPTLRLYPNDTHSSLAHNFNGISVKVQGKEIEETVDKVVFDGFIHIFTHAGDVAIERVFFTARNTPCLVEQLRVTNKASEKVKIEIVNNDETQITAAAIGADLRQYKLACEVENAAGLMEPGATFNAAAAYIGCNKNETVKVDTKAEYEARLNFIKELDSKLVITTPEKTLNTMIRYAKIHASENIFQTKGGLMHSPGGGGFYAALWTNNQCEYVNPLFGYLGYGTGFEQAVNCYNLYKKYISADKALITSIIAEGDGIWHGAKDRGDSAMYAYGASRFLLSSGNRELALSFINAIRDCVDFTLSQINEDGVIKSDSDELENRFKSGKANLSTACIAYDALVSSAYLEKELGNLERAEYCASHAEKLRINIENYFGSTVEGYDTYRYCAEETKLRSWICLPLAVGIIDRVQGTTDALLSPHLRMTEGLVTRSGEKTFWDRSTLYALRGLFHAGQQEKAVELLETYSNARLLGTHIPYCVEAFPEGNQAQLSAESGLYVRIYTEGILGYRPTGFNTFLLKPNLPAKWGFIKLTSFSAHNSKIDIEIISIKDGYTINISNGFKTDIGHGEEVEITL